MGDTCAAPGAEEIACQPGFNTLECCWLQANLVGTAVRQCAQYNAALTMPHQLHWLLAVAFATMALMAFGIGANDAANSWGTSVGSGAVQLKWAVLVGGFMDWAGAATLGAGALAVKLHVCLIRRVSRFAASQSGRPSCAASMRGWS